MLDIDVDSIMSQLKNKVSYRLKQTIEDVVNDPEANEYAKQKAESKSSVATVEGLDKLPGGLSLDSIKSGMSSDNVEGDLSSVKISDDMSANVSAVEKMLKKMKTIALRIKDRMINIFITFIIPLILAMFVANESVMYPAPVRIIYFVFTFVLCYVSQTAVGLLGTVYLGKFVYDYYVNKMEKRGIPLIVPPILAVLPVKVFDPSAPAAFFKDLVNFPLTYPRNERGDKNLLLIMNDYMESLKASFTYLDNVKSMPMFVEKLKKIDENMEQLHKLIPEPVNENEKNETNQPVSLPPSISKQPENIRLNESKQEDKKGPVPLTIAEQREKNGLSPMKSTKNNAMNASANTSATNAATNASTNASAANAAANTSANAAANTSANAAANAAVNAATNAATNASINASATNAATNASTNASANTSANAAANTATTNTKAPLPSTIAEQQAKSASEMNTPKGSLPPTVSELQEKTPKNNKE